MVLAKLHSDVLRTLAYADVFDYPLTLNEINSWLIGTKAMYTSGVYMNALPTVETHRGFYFFKGRSHLVKLRRNRYHFSKQKLQLACRVGEWLKVIPTIHMVAITGALAMNNSDAADDIDLMIVTAPHTLWLTRILVVPLISLVAQRRTPTRNPSNAICLNLWLDTTALAVPQTQRNLYTAHEVAQVKPLWNREDTYHRFLSANSWINQYLPNIHIPKIKRLTTDKWLLTTFFNQLAFRLQLWYMRSRLTREKVSLHAAFFHPRDTARLVMRQYHRRLVKLGIKL